MLPTGWTSVLGKFLKDGEIELLENRFILLRLTFFKKMYFMWFTSHPSLSPSCYCNFATTYWIVLLSFFQRKVANRYANREAPLGTKPRALCKEGVERQKKAILGCFRTIQNRSLFREQSEWRNTLRLIRKGGKQYIRISRKSAVWVRFCGTFRGFYWAHRSHCLNSKRKSYATRPTDRGADAVHIPHQP